MRKILEKNKKYILFTLFIIVIGIILGIIYFIIQDANIKNNIINTLKNVNNIKYNFIIKDLIIMSIILVLSFFIIGPFIGFVFLLYEGITIGFLLSIFFSTFYIKGLLYIIFYILINKILTLILIICFLKKTLNISRYIIGSIIYKQDTKYRERIVINLKKSLYIIIFLFIINIILYFVSSKSQYFLMP